VIAHETDVPSTVDPFAGSYAVESMTDDLEAAVVDLMAAVEARGGAVAAIEQGFQKGEIERSAYAVARQVEAGERVVVGVNRYAVAEEPRYATLSVDAALEAEQCARLAALRARRDAGRVAARLEALTQAARGPGSVLPPLKDALADLATVGEVCGALRSVWGSYVPFESV
jgi:methylmalonyl-CoA mutase, N-terminal domain